MISDKTSLMEFHLFAGTSMTSIKLDHVRNDAH